ncbi:MAG: hypothetical protein A3F54_01330 [Candidatus Kerfeldbacteria bacterium RIFCSPHIGHO2_12_FULL_48_17]|uniref:DUF1704 domain-containing protein n=1 Tax=Candidatus Kerfeldbacteria bacterium RIFCSPHIGHO2_12_FULL_48_17 TaxID=1798542 RepID=A0A1G2AYU6_9BACT|nr:MAG: hypothetical protein A3F54_01330 [Candidatus Kerfeldbacteria bacterium RIFCSPHIGHO2_12_FULL_48_17]
MKNEKRPLQDWAKKWPKRNESVGEKEDSQARPETNEVITEEQELSERVREWAERINTIGGDYNNAYNFIAPSGRDGRDIIEERQEFLNEQHYTPVFTYKKLEKEDFKEPLKKLQEIRQELKDEEKNEQAKKILQEVIDNVEAKMMFLKASKEGDDDKAFEWAKIAYGDIDDELVEYAEKTHVDKVEENAKKKSKLETYLRKSENSPEDAKYVFEEGLRALEVPMYDPEKGTEGWEVFIDHTKLGVSVEYASKEYPRPTVVVGGKTEVRTGFNVLELLAHEVGTHVRTNQNSENSGLRGTIFGRDYEVFQEGIALLAEKEFIKDVIGVDTNPATPFAVLAMNQVKQGKNFRETFNFIREKWLEHNRAEKQGLEEEMTPEKEAKLQNDTNKDAWGTCQRTFRGFHDLSKGGKYYPKDKAYLQGFKEVQVLAEHGLEEYLVEHKADATVIQQLLDLRLKPKDKVELKKVAQKIFADSIKWFFEGKE